MTILKSFCIAAASLCMSVALACESPPVVMIPDGASVTTDQLLEVQTQVRSYIAEMEEYLSCLDEEIEAAGGPDNAPPDYMALMITRHNAALDEMESVAASFNEQVRAHRAANPEE